METVVQPLTDVKSPFTGGRAALVRVPATLPYKGEQYEVMTEFYRCQDTGEEFTSIEQDDAVMLQLRALHRGQALNGTVNQAATNATADNGSLYSSQVGAGTGSYGHQPTATSFEHWRDATGAPQVVE